MVFQRFNLFPHLTALENIMLGPLKVLRRPRQDVEPLARELLKKVGKPSMAMTGMEANLRFAGPETMETKIFGRLTAWQNWIFQRPNAIGEQGALKLYGSGVSPTLNKERV